MDQLAVASIIDELPVGVVRLDADGRVVETNPAFDRWVGTSTLGRALDEFVSETDDFLDGADGPTRIVVATNAPDRAAFLVRESTATGSVVVVVDATDRLAAGRRLRALLTLTNRTRRRLELLLEASVAFSTAATADRVADVLAITSARAFAAEQSVVYLYREDGQLAHAAGADPTAGVVDLSALSQAALAWPRVLRVSDSADGEQVAREFSAAMTASGVHAVIAARITHGREILGVLLCFFLHPRQFDEEAAPLADALAGQAGQAFSSVQLQRQLEHAALHDGTTGLPNRRMLEEMTISHASTQRSAVIFIDLDGFKHINDHLGHDHGDRVLRVVADRLRSATRDTDTVIRYGGDEFVVIGDVGGHEDASALAERIRTTIEEPISSLPASLVLSASIGLALTPPTDEPASIDEFIRAADQAMYRAKRAGGNRIENHA